MGVGGLERSSVAVPRNQWRRLGIGRVVLIGSIAVAILGAGQGRALASGPPTVTITSAPPNPSSQAEARLSFTATASPAVFFCSLDRARATRCTSPVTYPVGSGPHVFSVSAKTSTTVKGPPSTWNWTVTGAGDGAINPWATQVENARSNFVPVAPHQALLDALHFNYIIAHPIAYQGLVAAMKQVNPRLALLAYLSGTFAQFTAGTSYPPSWYEYDANGNKVTNGYGNYLMNPTTPGWIQDRVATCQAFLAQSGYDGCYLDTLGLVSLGGHFDSGAPINPSTKQIWQPADWIAATATLAGQVRAAMSPVTVFGNGLSGGPTFYSTTSSSKPLIDAMSGGVAEAWLRGSVVPITAFPSQAAWLQNVQMIGAVEAEQKPLLTLTKVHVPGTQAQLAQWGQYALASFLLGTGGLSAFTWSPGPTVDRMSDYPLYHLALGAPTGTYTSGGGIFQRAFIDGYVVVNPTANIVAVTLPKPYYGTDGHRVTSVSMGSESGAIFTAYPTPATVIGSQPPPATSASAATITFSSGTAGVTFACQIDGGLPAPCRSPLSLSALPEGPHAVSVQAVTSTGIVGPPALAAWTVDVAPPTTTILAAPPSSTTSTSANFVFSASKPGATFSCSLDGAAPSICTPAANIAPTLAAPSGWTMPYNNLSVGTHTMAVSATDAYGLAGPAVTTTWIVT
jgi:hypothetical protein